MNRAALAVLALAGVAALAGAFLWLFERRSEEIRIPPSGEAAVNRYLAAETLLEAMGTPVRKFAKPTELPDTLPAGGTLFILSSDARFAPDRFDAILDWVSTGGHVVVVADGAEDDAEETEREQRPGVLALLTEAGIAYSGARRISEVESTDLEDPEEAADVRDDVERTDDADPGEDEASDPASDPDRVPTETVEAPEVEWLTAEGTGPGGAPLKMRTFGVFGWFEADETPLWKLESTLGIEALGVAYGEGSIGALNVPNAFQNKAIGQLDHAALLYGLAARSDGPLWLLTSGDWPGVLDLIRDYALEASISLALVVLLWVWAQSRRVGPILPDLADDRRELMEHVRASGRFHFRQRGAAELAAGVREAVLDRVRARHPSWLALPPRDLAERLADLTRISPDVVERVLAYPEALAGTRERRPNGEVFARNIATLERVRRAL